MRSFSLIGVVVVASMAVATAIEATVRVSFSTTGAQSNRESSFPKLSATGSLLGFGSFASNLVPFDTNNVYDGFLRDMRSGRITRVTIGDQEQQANDVSLLEAISGDDRFVTFRSRATNLVPGDTNSVGDVFLRDLVLQTTERVSIGNSGAQANDTSSSSAISADGRYVTFMSRASNLVAGDTNGWLDIFVRDRWMGTTRRVSVSSSGEQANLESSLPSITPDGRYVCFTSTASNLVDGDTNLSQDIFVHDTWTGTTERVSVSSDEVQGNSDSGGGIPNAITPDGRYVGFNSTASNLVSDDTNRVGDGFVRDRWLGTTVRVTLRSDGGQGNHGGGIAMLTDDGHYALIGSPSTNLTDDEDVNGRLLDVFMHDMWTGETWRISNNTNGEQGNAQSEACVMSANGMIVAFASNATNLAPNDTNGFMDIFVHINVRLRR